MFTDVEAVVTQVSELISSGTLDLGPVEIDHGDVEDGIIASFVASGCTCKHGKGKHLATLSLLPHSTATHVMSAET